jgi:septation ring formation regulator EzrA
MGQDEFNSEVLREIKAMSNNIATLTANYASQSKDITSIQECLSGLADWKQERVEDSTRHSEKIKAIDTRLSKIEDSNSKWFDRGWNAINTLAFMILGWWYLGRN